MEIGEFAIAGVEAPLIGVAHARHSVPVIARPAGQCERRTRSHDVQLALRIQCVAEQKQVALVGAAPVV